MKGLVKKMRQIADSVYAQVKPSKIQGVGVFAIRDIPKGTEPMESHGNPRRERFYKLSATDLKKLPNYFIDIIKNYSIKENDCYWVSLGSWNDYAVQDFLNHSDNPNVALRDDDHFVAMRDIKKGEELTADYRIFDSSWREKISLLKRARRVSVKS